MDNAGALAIAVARYVTAADAIHKFLDAMPNPFPKTELGCRPGQLFGIWYIEDARLEAYRNRVADVDLVALAQQNAEAEEAEMAVPGSPTEPPKPYLLSDGVALITISGPTTKYTTSFQRMLGGTSTMMVQRALRMAVADDSVKGIMLHMDDAPGGTVAGAYECRDEIRAAAAKKPMCAHVSDLCASAGYLFAAATGGEISANATAYLGSIGTRTALVDLSEKFKKEGIKTIPVVSGKFKAAGMPGTEITPEIIGEVQSHIDELNDMFITSIATDRKIPEETVRGMEARTFITARAIEQKLADRVCSFEEAFSAFAQKTGTGATRQPVNNPAPALRSTQMNLLDKIRQMANNPGMTEEQAIAYLGTMQTDLTAARAALPKQEDPGIVNERLEIFVQRADVAVAGGKVPAPVAASIKAQAGFVAGDGATHKPNAFMLAKRPEMGGASVADAMLKAFDGVEIVAPKEGTKTPEQRTIKTIERTVPGGAADADDKEALDDADRAVASYKAARGITADAK